MDAELVDPGVTSALRRAVLRPGWTSDRRMPGDDDPNALHIAALDDFRAPVGACVLVPGRCPSHPDIEHAWQLRGMATAEGHRGEGIGAAVVTHAIAVLDDRGAQLLWCKARVSAANFYARLGFDVDTEDYIEPETGLPHRDMSRRLPT